MSLALLAVLIPVLVQPDAAAQTIALRPYYLAIVIDDFGQDRGGVDRMISLDASITCAVMPGLEYTQADAQAILDSGKEVIVHLPMQAPKTPLSWYGPVMVPLGSDEQQAYDVALRAASLVPGRGRYERSYRRFML